MRAEIGDAPRAMRIACDQIGDDLLDAALYPEPSPRREKPGAACRAIESIVA